MTLPADLTFYQQLVPFTSDGGLLTTPAMRWEVAVVQALQAHEALIEGLVSAPADSITDLTGDVTATGPGSASATIANGAVSLAKMANIATDRLIGRDTASTGVPEALTVGGGIEFTGSGGIQRSALTGDVTASAGSGATTIANDAVTYAKMQNVSAASRLLGRGSASGAGDPQEITLGSRLSMTSQVLDAVAPSFTEVASASLTGTDEPLTGLGTSYLHLYVYVELQLSGAGTVSLEYSLNNGSSHSTYYTFGVASGAIEVELLTKMMGGKLLHTTGSASSGTQPSVGLERNTGTLINAVRVSVSGTSFAAGTIRAYVET